MKFTAVGDILVQKRLPQNYEGFDEIRSFIEQGDARFFNLETTLNYEGECFASQFSGGTYVRANPEMYYDMLRYGFNMTSANNNHAFDFSFEGFARTLKTLNESGITHAGIGNNLHQAAAPAYLETDKGRVALVAVNLSFNAAMMAGEQSRRVAGRPGINGIRLNKKVIVPKEDFEAIKRVGDRCGINCAKMITRGEGYYPYLPEGVAEIDEQQFILGDDYGLRYDINKTDLERLKASVREAEMCADYVIVSVHHHQIEGMNKATVPEFHKQLMRDIIDFGADAVIGHGPHLLRAIEVYKDKPIFYSLGDFLIQLYDVAFAPEDFYVKYGMSSDDSAIELLRKRSSDFTRGLMAQKEMREAVIPLWETDGKRLKSLKLMPIYASCGEGKYIEGLPQPARDLAFMDKLAELSRPYGVEIKKNEDGTYECFW
jgi:poly-gamma-glutamate synthesis protein (capsule biosynthesis protein)